MGNNKFKQLNVNPNPGNDTRKKTLRERRVRRDMRPRHLVFYSMYYDTKLGMDGETFAKNHKLCNDTRNNSLRGRRVRGNMSPRHLVLYKLASKSVRYARRKQFQKNMNPVIGTQQVNTRKARARGYEVLKLSFVQNVKQKQTG